jgi:FAD/FMN-containing dehydrogenase
VNAHSIATDLQALVQGDARFDEVTRVLYSTGACMYRVKPLGVVFPKSREDAIATVRYAADRGIHGCCLGFYPVHAPDY